MRHAGEIAALLTAVSWTLSSLCFTSAGRRVGSLSVNLIRLSLAWLYLILYGALVRGAPFPADAPPRAWLWLGLSGFVGFFLGDLCLFKAFVLVGPRLSTLLMSLAPPIAAGLGVLFLDERLSATNWLGMAATIAGVSWVVLERPPNGAGVPPRPSARGLALAALAAVGQAVGLVLSKLGMGPEGYDPFAATHIRVLPGVAGFAILIFALGRYPRVLETLRDARAFALIALGAFLGPFLGVGLLLFSVQRVPAGVAQTIVSIMPVLIVPFVVVLYKERVSWRAFLGACVAVAGVALLFYR